MSFISSYSLTHALTHPLLPHSAQSHPKLGFLGLIGMAIISVDSIRNLPINAQYGLPVLTFYAIAGLTFFWPLVNVSREFAGKYDKTGGSYLWIQSAFGRNVGFLSIWLQWVYNMIWYPTIFTFISSTLASLISPELVNNAFFIILSSLVLFWIITAISCCGVEATTWLSVFSSIIGTLLPMTILIILAVSWLAEGNISATPIGLENLLPDENAWINLGYYSNILFSLLGIEVVTMHVKEVKNPESTYYKGLMIAGIIIILSLALSSVSLCIVVAPRKLSMLSGLMDAFKAFFDLHNMPLGTYFIGVAIVIGSLGVTSSWIIGLARGMQVAFLDSGFPRCLFKKNKCDMPYVILLIQGAIYSVLLMSYMVFPDISSSYWILSSMTSQFSLACYILLFVAVLKLKKQEGNLTWLGALGPCSAIVSCAAGIMVGYLPPSNVERQDYWKFELMLIGGEIAFIFPIILISVISWARRNTVKASTNSKGLFF